jgi:hypothetical protein
MPVQEIDPVEFKNKVTEFAHSDALEHLIEGLITGYRNAWHTTRPDDVQHREHLYRMTQACEALKREIVSVALNDTLAEFNERRKFKGVNVVPPKKKQR